MLTMEPYKYVDHLIMTAHDYAVGSDDPKETQNILYLVGYATGLMVGGAPLEEPAFAQAIETLEFVAAKSLLQRAEALV